MTNDYELLRVQFTKLEQQLQAKNLECDQRSELNQKLMKKIEELGQARSCCDNLCLACDALTCLLLQMMAANTALINESQENLRAAQDRALEQQMADSLKLAAIQNEADQQARLAQEAIAQLRADAAAALAAAKREAEEAAKEAAAELARTRAAAEGELSRVKAAAADELARAKAHAEDELARQRHQLQDAFEREKHALQVDDTTTELSQLYLIVLRLSLAGRDRPPASPVGR